jgi:Flp pilus assembly protein TadG
MALIRLRRRGALTTEAALFLPVLVLLLLAGAETGWMTWRSWQLERAVERGALVASTPLGTRAQVEVAVADAMRRAGLGQSGFRTTVTPEELRDVAPGSPVTVTVSLRYAHVSLTGLGRLPLLPRRVAVAASRPKQAPMLGSRSLPLEP